MASARICEGSSRCARYLLRGIHRCQHRRYDKTQVNLGQSAVLIDQQISVPEMVRAHAAVRRGPAELGRGELEHHG
eukprot:COSAG01_NODE_6932_length_3434_cov_10.042879_4_plen_76_part_00